MSILVTGASGFLGPVLIRRLVETYPTGRIRAVARNEGNLIKLQQWFPGIEIFAGDLADPVVCDRALRDVDEAVYHLAAFKHVGMAEQQARQCTRSNVVGTLNLLDRFRGHLFLAISSDKAVRVAGVYGASKMLMERIIQEFALIYSDTAYRVVRYGNVLYSTGSVTCKWRDALQQRREITVTDPSATRYFWTVDQAVGLIFECVEKAQDATPYCPVMKAMCIGDLLEAMQQKYGRAAKINTIGLQPGENMHERVLEVGVTSDQAERYTVEEIRGMV